MKTADIHATKNNENGDFIESKQKSAQTVGYLRVSTGKQETEKNKSSILKFANERNLGKVTFVEEKVSGIKDWRKRKLAAVLDELKKGDNLVVPELSRLGRSMLGILEVLKIAKEKAINVFAIKGDWSLNNTIQSKMVSGIFAMIAEVERDLISMRTKEALEARKKAGIKLGRPKGPGKSKLDKFDPEIKALLSAGSTLKYIARRYGCAESTLINWLTKRKISRKNLVEKNLKKYLPTGALSAFSSTDEKPSDVL